MLDFPFQDINVKEGSEGAYFLLRISSHFCVKAGWHYILTRSQNRQEKVIQK
jgi:hypothetical protein